MTPRSRRLTALTATAAVAAVAVVVHAGRGPVAEPAVASELAGRSAVAAPAPTPQAVAESSTPSPRAASGSADTSSPSPTTRQGRRQTLAQASHQVSEPVMPRRLSGREVLETSPELLPELARRNDTSESALRTLFAEDESVNVVTSGRVYFADPEPQQAIAAGAGSGVPLTALYPQAQTFTLHSRPGAARTVYLDFNGANVSGTAWNDPTDRTLPDGYWKGWDSNGDAATFSDAELAWMQHVWRQVSESFAVFDVDVTTADPGSAALQRSATDDTSYGTRVVFTSDKSANDVACNGCFGIAFQGVFDDIDATGHLSPAWVFVDDPTYSPILAAQGAAHEIGHTLGLRHDGHGSTTYFSGTKTWGPIMGMATMRATSQWSHGEYAGASNTEDDLKTMTDHRLPLLADDHANTPGGATDLGRRASYAAEGVVTSRSDVDTFRVELPCATTFEAAARGIGAQTTLDLSLELVDASGASLATVSPASSYATTLYPLGGLMYPLYTSTGMDATLQRAVPAGTYYLNVDGVGNGDPTGAGWSDYASIGDYTLTATGCPEPTPTSSPSTGPTEVPSASPSPSPTTAPSTTPAPAPATPAPVVLGKPGAPTIGTASSGASGGTVNATVRWTAPASTGGQALLGYRVRAYKLDYRNRVVATYTSTRVSAAARTLVYRLPQGRYSFVTSAENGLGASPWSARSRIVTAR